jgi:hypothetical protein
MHCLNNVSSLLSQLSDKKTVEQQRNDLDIIYKTMVMTCKKRIIFLKNYTITTSLWLRGFVRFIFFDDRHPFVNPLA